MHSSKTCPTCRGPSTSAKLIKLFFEIDDSKTTFSIEEILKTNDELSEKCISTQNKSQQLDDQLKEALKKLKLLEIQREMDLMAIAGLKSIKEESAKEIIKLTGWINTLKLDLLAEKQLRRIHQLSLKGLDPHNENYNIENVNIDEPKSKDPTNQLKEIVTASTSCSIIPFWKLNCESSKPIDEIVSQLKSSASSSYIIPSKIQKASSDRVRVDKLQAYRCQKSLISNNSQKPVGYKFKLPEATPSTSQPSTSAAALNRSQKRTFGEGFLFIPGPTASTSNNEDNFRFNTIDGPIFQPSANLTSIDSNIPLSLRNYRDPGPKISDR